ncbi:stage II sporulation protein M [Haloimpatiens sp. FM7315]|uniref:stage II sporulation protein M n=1 Tax=Haloimpatiens sp. FM7315 TaxID=3298609 RepID=UPI00370CB849
MFKNVEIGLNRHLKENVWLYILSISCMFIGMLVGVFYVKHMAETDKGAIYEYLSNFTSNLSSLSIDNKKIFFQAMKNILPLVIAIWFLGFTIIGIPIIAFLDFIKGFTLGFSICSLINSLGGKGIWMSVFGIIPQNVIYLPCIVFISVLAMELSLSTFRNRLEKQWTTNVVNTIGSYSLVIFIIIIFSFLGFFIEGYFTPHMVKLIV